jgi:hypothetical protein
MAVRVAVAVIPSFHPPLSAERAVPAQAAKGMRAAPVWVQAKLKVAAAVDQVLLVAMEPALRAVLAGLERHPQ